MSLPIAAVELRRRRLDALPLRTVRALYASLPGRHRTLAQKTLLSKPALIDIIVWTEFSDWNRVSGRGGTA
jgi:hypothetical protein